MLVRIEPLRSSFIAAEVGGSIGATTILTWRDTLLALDNYANGALGNRLWMHTDALGSVAVRTLSDGTIQRRHYYAPYGEPYNSTILGLGYTGHDMDADTGLVYMQARYYDPQIGRFLSVDPVTADSGDLRHFNRYAYAYDNPYRFTDLDGRIPVETVWDAANVAIGVSSFGANVAAGNYVGATVDAVGVVIDAAATVTPYVPGGAGTAIKAARAADKVADAAKTANKASDAGKVTKAGDLSAVKDSKLKADGIDAHAVKKEAVGSKEGGKFNISVDKKTGDVFLTPVKKGASDPVPLNVKYDDLKK